MGKRTDDVKRKSVGREYAEAIIIAIIAAFLIRALVIQAFKIPSGSMKATLLVGDHILVNKFIYRFTDPKRGDVIVFKYPRDEKKDFIKRVVGMPGERLEVKNKTVFINGEPLEEPYAVHNGFGLQRNNFGPVIIPSGHLFMMGDNRDNSKDSRYWGFLDMKKIKGKAFIIYFSWNKNGDLVHKVRWDRFGDLVR